MPKIQKGNGIVYNPETFHTFKRPNSFLCEDPDEILERIKPFEYRDMKLIMFDSETHPFYKNSHEVPPEVVRRWVGKGKAAVPQDYPFEMSFCDGVNTFALYDSYENGFEKFKRMAPLMEDASIDKVAHNFKFDGHQYANIDMKIKGRIHDTVVLAKLADENRSSFELRELAESNPKGIVTFEYMVDSYKQINHVKDYRNIPVPLLTEYANADVWNCFVTFIDEYEKIVQDELVDLYNQECECTVVLYAMERYGMKINEEYEQPLKQELQELTDASEKEVYEEAGTIFNMNSGKQLYDVLMKVGVKPNQIGTTDKGNPKLDKLALAKLSNEGVSIVDKILDYRQAEKLLGTYANGIYEQRDSNYKVHGNINQTEATTGRMSITKPALQTLPKRDKRIRKCFVPDEGYELWFMDLDQIEYRGFAHYAKAQSLLDAIAKGYDVHAATAADLFHIDAEEFINKYKADDKEIVQLRDRGKTMNFAMIYGVGRDKLALDLKCGLSEADRIKADYFTKFPEAKTFIATVHQVVKYRGYVKNFFGRRRRLSGNDCYKAPNALIQGWAADYIKNKMILMYKYIQYNNLKTKLINIVHDEIIIMAHKSELHHLPYLRWLLSDFTTYRCPITAGAEKGNPSWGEKVTLEEDIGFKEPEDKGYEQYSIYDGQIFDIYKEVVQ